MNDDKQEDKQEQEQPEQIRFTARLYAPMPLCMPPTGFLLMLFRHQGGTWATLVPLN